MEGTVLLSPIEVGKRTGTWLMENVKIDVKSLR